MRARKGASGFVAAAGILMAALAVLLLPGAALANTSFPCAQGESRSEVPSAPSAGAVGVEPGKVAADFTLPDLDGEPLSLSRFRGCVVVVEFWASWCPPCWDSARHLEALRRRNEGRGLVLLGVSLDRGRDAIDMFLEATGEPGIIVLWGSLPEAREVAEMYGVRAIPRALVVDREGVIRFAGHPARITDGLLAPLW